MAEEEKKKVEVKEKVKQVTEQIKAFSYKQLIMVGAIVFGALANVLWDYVNISFDASIFVDPAYWIQLITGQAAVVMFMLVFRSFMKEKEEGVNVFVKKARDAIRKAQTDLTDNNANETFEDYVYDINMKRKKKAYTLLMERRIARARKDERRKKLQKELMEGLKEEKQEDGSIKRNIEYIKVKYEKIRIVSIFSHAGTVGIEDASLDEHESKSVALLLLNKVFAIIAFGLLGTSFAFQSKAFLFGYIISTCLKLFQTAFALYTGGSDGVAYVRGPLLSTLENRARFLQSFAEVQSK